MHRFLFVASSVFVAALGAARLAHAQVIGSWQGSNNTWSANAWAHDGSNGMGAPNGIGHTALFNNASTGTATQDVAGLAVGTISYNGQGTTTTGNGVRTIGMDNNITLNQDNLPAMVPGPGSTTIEYANPNTTTTAATLIFGSATVRGELILADDLLVTNSTNITTNGAAAGAIQIFSAITGAGNVTFLNTAAIGTPTNSSVPRGIWLRNGTANSTFAGNVFIKKGLVAFNSATSFGDPSNVITLGEAGQGSAMMIGTEALAGVGLASKLIVAADSGGTLTFGTASNNGANTVHSGPIELNTDANLRGGTTTGSGVQTYSGVISGVGGLTKVGGEVIVILEGANTYAGKTNVQVGTVRVASLNRVTSGTPSSNFGAPTTAANGTIGLGGFNNAGAARPGILDYVGPGETTDRVIDLAGTSGGATIFANGAGPLVFESDFTATGAGIKTLTLAGTNSDGNSILGAIVDSATDRTEVNKTGLGKWVFSGINLYTGTTTVNDGTLDVEGALAKLGSGDVSVVGGILEVSAGVANAVADTATVNILGTGKLNLGSNVQDTIASLFLGGIEQTLPGTYGSTSSAATYKFDDYFSGEGVLKIPSASMPGDFNGDNKVDAADYVVWRKTMPENTAKYEEWRTNFGNPPGSGSMEPLSSGSAVPEPVSFLSAALAACILLIMRARTPAR